MSSSFKTLPFFLTLFIVACGGSGSDDTPVTPPSNLNAPNAIADNATTLNNSAVTVAVLANDTDVEGDTLSLTAILTVPTQGTAEISGNSVVYTPNPDQINTDSFTYEVSDGEKTSSAVVSIDNTQSITFAGTATDSPLANAGLIVTVNGIDAETTTDNQGQYSIEVPLTSLDGNIIIKAQGESGSAQAQATLFSFVGSVADAFAQAGENRALDESSRPSLNLNQLSTAEYLLALASNEADLSKNSSEFARLVKLAKATELLELAGFIKLIIDNPAYSLPENETIESFFTSSTAGNPRAVVRKFLAERNLINTSGDYTETFAIDFDLAMSTTAEQFNQAFELDSIVGQKFVFYVGDLEHGLLPRLGDIYEFTSSTAGIYWSANEFDSISYEFNWALSDGIIVITYDPTKFVGNESFPQYSDFEVFRFGEEAREKAAQINDGFGFPSGQLRILQRPKSDIISLIGQNSKTHQVFRKRTDQEVLFLQDQSETHQFTFDQDFSFTNTLAPASSDILLSQEIIEGQWVTHLFYGYIPEIPAESPYDTTNNQRLNADILTLTADNSAITEYSDKSYTWTLVANKTLKLFNQTQTIEITPFIETSNGFSALFVETIEGEIVRQYVREIYKLDDVIDVDVPSLVTTGSEAYISLISATSPRAWESGMLDLDLVLAYQFNQDNTIRRLAAFYDDYEVKTDPYFEISAAWVNRSIQQENTSLTFSFVLNGIIRKRTWQFVKTNSAGQFWVLESFYFANDDNDDGIYDRYIAVIPPRITSFIKADLSEYEEAWANTVERGTLTP